LNDPYVAAVDCMNNKYYPIIIGDPNYDVAIDAMDISESNA
jgi:hypothetical protein